MRRFDGLPGEGRGAPHDVGEAGQGGSGDDGGDRGRAEPVVVLLEEEAEAGRREQDATVEKDAQLRPDRDEVPPGDRGEGPRLGFAENALRAELLDGGDDLGVRAPILPRRRQGSLYDV
jgi:hypothetical protein